MKRDLEFIRDFLMKIEADETSTMFPHTEVIVSDGKPVEVLPSGWDWKTNYHFELLKDAGLVKGLDFEFSPGLEDAASGVISVKKFRLTNAGHDYLDAIRDEGIWSKTKAVVSESGGNVTVEVLKSLAIGLLKKKISQHTDIEL